MKLSNLALVAMLAVSSTTTLGCDVNKHASDIGFKQGDNLVEKGTIKYDTLVDKDEMCNMKWADYESNLQRRADLIPMLVSVVKGAGAQESTTLVAIAQAQANATRPEVKLDPKNGDMEDPAKFAAFQQAQSTLGTQMSRLMVQAPAMYPNLATSGQFHDLQIQIEGTENRLLRARARQREADEAADRARRQREQDDEDRRRRDAESSSSSSSSYDYGSSSSGSDSGSSGGFGGGDSGGGGSSSGW